MAVEVKISGKQISVRPGLVRVADLRARAEVSGGSQVFLERKGDIDFPLGAEDALIIRGGEQFSLGEAGKSGIDDNPPVRNPLACVLNGERIPEFKRPKVLGGELRGLDKTLTSSKLFADISGSPDALVGDEVRIVLQGGEEFFTIPADAEEGGIVDLEKCAKSDRRPPKGQKGYRIRIDGEVKIAPKEKMTGAEILALVDKKPDEWSLSQKFPGGRRERIESGRAANLAAAGVERFETSPKQIQQGGMNVGVTDEDAEFLDSLGKSWEVEESGGGRMLVIRDFNLPMGFNHEKSDLMVVIPPNYPVAGLDMFYLAPGVRRKDGQPIGALAVETRDGRRWQRWSRHYSWQAGYGVANHCGFVEAALSGEAARRIPLGK